MRTSNPALRYTVVKLERAGKKGPSIWRDASTLLSNPGSEKVEVNLERISKVSEEGSSVFVPGKVLGGGVITKKVVVGAFSYSASAKKKIVSAGGSALTVEEFLKKHPKGSGVKLVK